jgi:uncharacterized protein (TIGR03663 family)
MATGLAPISAAGMPSERRDWLTALTYVAALALFLRFYDLPLKPLHHDEGVNTLFVTTLARPPHTFVYDPGNYHGPTLFYFAWLGVSLFGFTIAGMRVVTAAAGLLTVLLVLALRPQLGTRGAVAAAAMLAASSGAVYYSRYFIHESLLTCFTLGGVVCAVKWWSSRRTIYLYLGAAAVGLMFATKETAVISAVAIVGATVGAVLFAGRAPVAQATRFVADVRERGAAGALLFAALVAGTVALLFYTSFLTNPRGAIAALETFAIWTRTGTATHTNPWYTYVRWLSIEELPLLLAGTAGIAAALRRPADRFASFSALWAVGVLTAYSVIPYKTPWLVLNAIVPLALCAGVAFERLSSMRSQVVSVASAVMLVAAVGAGTARASWLSFWHYDSERSPYVYVHTSREILPLVDAVARVEAAHPGTLIAVTSPVYFPLPWYLRDYPVGYHGRVIATGAPIVIASLDQQRALDATLGGTYERLGPYLLRPGVRLLLYVRRDLWTTPREPGVS